MEPTAESAYLTISPVSGGPHNGLTRLGHGAPFPAPVPVPSEDGRHTHLLQDISLHKQQSPYHAKVPRRPDPTAPTHESMRAKGWVVDKVERDPDTGKKITIYRDPKRMPVASKDHRPVAEDMRHPNRKLVQMQGGHSSDHLPVRDLRLTPHDAFVPDSTNDLHNQADSIRIELEDRALRMQGLNWEAPAAEYQKGNKAGFYGEQQIVRHMPYNPATQRDQMPKNKPTDTSAAMPNLAVRPSLDSRTPNRRLPDAYNRPGAANSALAGGGSHAGVAYTDTTRMENVRLTTGVRPEDDITRSLAAPMHYEQDGHTMQSREALRRKPEFATDWTEQANDVRPLGYYHHNDVSGQDYTRAVPVRADRSGALDQNAVAAALPLPLLNEGVASTLTGRQVNIRDGLTNGSMEPGVLHTTFMQDVGSTQGIYKTLQGRAPKTSDVRNVGPVATGGLAHQLLSSLGIGITKTVQGLVRSSRGNEQDQVATDLVQRANVAGTGVEAETFHPVHERLASSKNDNQLGRSLQLPWGHEVGGHGMLARQALVHSERERQRGDSHAQAQAPTSVHTLPAAAMMAAQ